jgi:hypothetical protein
MAFDMTGSAWDDEDGTRPAPLGHKEAPSVADNKRVERIVSHIPSFMNERTPFDMLKGVL